MDEAQFLTDKLHSLVKVRQEATRMKNRYRPGTSSYHFYEQQEKSAQASIDRVRQQMRGTGPGGFEPPSPVSKTGVLPLNDGPSLPLADAAERVVPGSVAPSGAHLHAHPDKHLTYSLFGDT